MRSFTRSECMKRRRKLSRVSLQRRVVTSNVIHIFKTQFLQFLCRKSGSLPSVAVDEQPLLWKFRSCLLVNFIDWDMESSPIMSSSIFRDRTNIDDLLYLSRTNHLLGVFRTYEVFTKVCVRGGCCDGTSNNEWEYHL